MQQQLYTGDTLKFAELQGLYLAADGWQSKARFAPQQVGSAALTVTAADVDGAYEFTVPASATEGWTTGSWTATTWVEKNDDRHTLQVYTLQVLPNPANANQGIDARSHVKKTLDALEAMLEGKAGKDVQRYTIMGRELHTYPIPDLLIMRDKYRAEYANEQRIAKGQPFGGRGRKIYARF